MNNNMYLLAIIVFFPMIGAFASYLTGKKSKTMRDNLVGGIAIVEFLMLLYLWSQTGNGNSGFEIPGFCGMGLRLAMDGFRVLYGTIAAFMWMMTALFSKEYFAHYRNRNRYYLFQLLTLGATEGIFLSADLYTTFIFFEVMSMASYVWVAQDERKESLRAAATYLAVAVIGGLVMLMGIFLLYHQTGTLVIADLHEACHGKNVYVAAGLMFFGFAAKAGAFPLHIWLPKAHPVAPAPASALLSGILTKTGVFGILVISCQIFLHDWKWGTFVFLIGTVTMFGGAVLALFSIDFKRTLACSSVSQIGFILVGVGMQGLLGEENALAVRGSLLHMVNHSLFKLLLFMIAGVIYMNIHKLDLNDIRGFGRKKPFLAIVYLSGALGIGGIPLFSGYVSKTLIHESIVEYMEEVHEIGFLSLADVKVIEWIFLISGGLTVAYMCKLFVAVFIEKNKDAAVQAKYDAMSDSYISPLSRIVLAVCAVIIPVLGAMPNLTMDKLATMGQGFMGLEHFEHEVEYFSMINLKGAIISIVIGALIYIIIARKVLMQKENRHVKNYVNRWPRVLDLEDYLYRPILLKILPGSAGAVCMILDHLVDFISKLLPIAPGVETGLFDTIQDSVVMYSKKHVYKGTPLPHELEEGNTVTHGLGKVLNVFRDLLNATFRRKNPVQRDFVHSLAVQFASFKENSGLIGRSLSYGLILFAIGLCGTLIYLLIVLIGWM